MRYLWVGLGGAFGSMARYAIGVRVDQAHFPWATLGISGNEGRDRALFADGVEGHQAAEAAPATSEDSWQRRSGERRAPDHVAGAGLGL